MTDLKLCEILLQVFLGTPQERERLDTRWQSFKERHIIADDPYYKEEQERLLRERRELEERIKQQERDRE